MGYVRGLIVFDLDGTLIDSERDLADSVNALLAERGAAPLPEPAIGGMVGDGAAMLVRRAFEAAGLPRDESTLPRFLALYDQRLLRTTRPYPGMIEALHAIANRGVLAVLTNKPLGHTRKLLEGLSLAPFFRDALGGDGPFARKPDPAALRHLMEQHGVRPSNVVVVGDSAIDADTARAAGAAFCLAAYGFGARAFPPGALSGVVRAAAPSEIPAAISQLLG